MRVWQVAAGDPGRDYSKLFLDHDVMLLGPGAPGDIRDAASTYDGWSAAKVGAIRDFCHKVEPGDYVIMRVGRRVVGLGVVPEADYCWDDRFDDIHGWDLQHMRRVCWAEGVADRLEGLQRQAGFFSGRRSMFSRFRQPKMIEKLRPLLEQCQVRPLKPLPDAIGPALEDDEAGQLLFSHGLPQGSVDALLTSIGRQRRLLRWYKQHGQEAGRPTEHEVVAYMVLPMLLALGWSEQLLAVEWKSIDLAAFDRTPTTASACAMVCEAKGMQAGLQGRAYAQARQYVKTRKLTGCRHILLTQGERFYLYERDDEGVWQPEPRGYLNLTKLRANCILPRNTNAIDTLMALTPQGVFGGNGR